MSDSNFSKLCEWKKVHEVVDEAWAEDCLSDDEVECSKACKACCAAMQATISKLQRKHATT